MDALNYCLYKAREIPYVKSQQRHYAVVLDKRGRVIAEAANSYTKTSRKQYEVARKLGLPEKICIHAEAQAIFRSKGRGCKLVVVRVNSSGEKVLSAPCVVCREIIKLHKGINSVEFSI